MSWVVAAASHRGEGHARRGERRQDALRALPAGPDGGALVAVVSDGAGSAARGGAGAALACRIVSEAARAALAEGRGVGALREEDVAGWVEAARGRIAEAAATHGLAPRDFAATLVVALSDAGGTLVGHVGDGAAVARICGEWRALSWPEAGDHAGSTHFLTDEAMKLRVARCAEPATALALFSDGIERLVLDFAAEIPHAPFFGRMAAPLERLGAPGRDPGLSRALRAYLAGGNFAARSDDDRTLIVATRIGAEG